MQPLVNLAVRAARRAGEIIVRSINKLDSIEVSSKGRNDFVSEVDRAAEADIIATIRKLYPNHAFLAEESGTTGSGEVVWIVDPLDGTTNFLHNFPQYAVSIACQIRGKLEHAVVYDPLRQEIFTASRGDGAYLEGRRMRVTRQLTLAGSLIATGFPFRASDLPRVDAYMAMLRKVMETTSGVRRAGAASLDLAYVAAGRVDGFWEMGLGPWDTAAGALLVQEAGGRIGSMKGEVFNLQHHVIAGTPRVYTALLECLTPHLPKDLD